MLKIYVGDDFLELSQNEIQKLYIGEGKEGKVYRYGDEALKIYREHPGKCVLDEEDAIKLSNISTNRVLLPKKMIYAEDKVTFSGYSTKFINKAPSEEVIDIDIMRFLDELDMVNEDLVTLANNKVAVYDYNLDNLFYDGNIYLGDPGSYTILDSMPFEAIYRRNNWNLFDFVVSGIFNIVSLGEGEFLKVFTSFNKYKYIGEQIRKDAEAGETVRQYVKKISE